MLLSSADIKESTFSIDASIEEGMKRRHDVVDSVTANLCANFQKGTCMNGSKCPFRHVRSEKNTVCKHWLRGLCKKQDTCEFLHEYDLTKMPLCHFFATFGKCNNVDCLFLHVKEDEKSKECPWYSRGFCKAGPSCKYMHVQKQACPQYLAGFCSEGPNCRLGHPKHEISLDDTETTFGNRGSGGFKHVICLKCGGANHLASACPLIPNVPFVRSTGGGGSFAPPSGTRRPNLRPVEFVQCFKCGQKGHYANACPNPRKAPPPGGYRVPGKGVVADPRKSRFSLPSNSAPSDSSPIDQDSAMKF
eukprot:TRINITY_DN784_c0_g2_i2.p1 TRINITY_DN784_c0_g2~~TRINITY_DN784_c0_g2_i2.p1  ORF type:complete len:304 (+),score=26.25 TRINITY_DN784_c0_g2_i2:44-955(+)